MDLRKKEKEIKTKKEKIKEKKKFFFKLEYIKY